MKNSDNDLSVMLAQDCVEAFERLDVGLRRILDLRRPVPLCRYRLRNKEDFNARIRQPGHAAHLAMVEMNSGTLSTLHQSIDRSSKAILSAITPVGQTAIDADQLLTSVYDVAIHFILLHELYHIYEGHLDFLSHRKGHSALAETGRCFTGDDPQLDRDTAYYLEMEADGSALVSLLTHITFQSIVKQATAIEAVNPDHEYIQDLTGQARLFAFRIILSAAWIVGSLMEVNRPNDDHQVLPLARMLSMISTLLSWFIEANELEANEQGELIQRLNEKQPLLIAMFLNDVAKPVIVSLWQFPGSTAEASKVLFRSSNALEQFLRDMQSLLCRQPTTSPFAQQIVISELLRGTLEGELAPYRYIIE